jgi:hypothetical protein
MASTAATNETLLPLTGETFRAVSRYVRPAPEESRWREIPWQTDLRDACRIAAETGKPIFLWAMNGNPLGCT